MSIFGKPKPPVKSLRPTNREKIPESTTSSSHTVISEGTVIEGEVSSNDMLVIEGRVEGNVTVKNAVTIGKNGRVNAGISATSLDVLGKIIGDVIATDRVTIGSTGSIEGNIRSPKLMISEGAHFRGNIDMSQHKGEEKKLPTDSQEKRFDLRKDVGLHSTFSSDS